MDGPLQSALLSLYVLVAVIPALLVMAEYLDSHPAALANHLTHHYGLSAPTAALVHSVLVQDRHHELGSALLAIAGALFFGLGFGRVLQIVHTELKELSGGPSFARFAVTPGWIAILIVYFAWAARVLTHKQVSWRDLLPGAALTATGLVVLIWISRFVMEFWINFYARDYGGFGVVMAIFFWIAFSSFVIVAAASLAPALAERRDLHEP
ncbi:MAG: YihY/virulence factor BrkB family protein [Actinobacteria bacterium]|nr:MAG: YihY/virulence factor BrkB family protein [Actinomycetota bacterium]